MFCIISTTSFHQTTQIFNFTMFTMQNEISKADVLTQSYQYGLSMFKSPATRETPRNAHLFGFPIAHSLSPVLHASLFSSVGVPWNFTLIESKDKHDFIPRLRHPSCIGSAVTMPHKVTFMTEVDYITEEAKLIGAINTVFKRKDKNNRTRCIGTNTDCIGIRDAFMHNFPNVLSQSSGRPALVIGGGGTCRSAVYTVWKWMGASEIYIINRFRDEVADIIASFAARPEFTGKLIHVETVEQANALESPTLIVSAVPDILPKTPEELLAKDVVASFLERAHKGLVLEMCYHPHPRTAFFDLAVGYGWQVIPGTEAMIYQGVAQQVLWLELPSGDFDITAAEREVRKAMELSSKI
jgi:quinate dehydrogenase